jgi:hypothetical protein
MDIMAYVDEILWEALSFYEALENSLLKSVKEVEMAQSIKIRH